MKEWYYKNSIFVSNGSTLLSEDYYIEDFDHLKDIQSNQLKSKEDCSKVINHLFDLLYSSGIENELNSFLLEFEELNNIKDINLYKDTALLYNNRLNNEFEKIENQISLKVKAIQQQNNKKIYQFNGFKNYLYHAMDFDQARQALENNKLEGYTHQRYWKDGIRRKDDDPNYEDSYTMKGVCLTREFKFALGWGRIILILDKERIKNNNKLIPYSWNYSIGGTYKPHHKKEKEEFLKLAEIPHNGAKKYNPEFQNEYEYFLKNKEKMIQEYDDDLESLEKYYKTEAEKYDPTVFNEPSGSINLNKILKGIVIKSSDHLYEKDYEFFTNHPLFLGFYEK